MSTGSSPYYPGSPYHAQQALPVQSGYPPATMITGQYMTPPHNHMLLPTAYPPFGNPYFGGFNYYGVPVTPHGIPYGANFLAPYHNGYQFPSPGAAVNASAFTSQASHQWPGTSPQALSSVTVASQAAIPDDELLEDLEDDPLESVLKLTDSDIKISCAKHPTLAIIQSPSIKSTIQQDKPSGKRRGSETHAAFTALYAVYCDVMFQPKIKFFDKREGSVEKGCAGKITYANWIWSVSIKERVRENASLKEALVGYAKLIKSSELQACKLFCLKNAGLFQLQSDVLIYAPYDYQDMSGNWSGASVTVVTSTEEMRKGLRFHKLNDVQTNIVDQAEYAAFQQRLASHGDPSSLAGHGINQPSRPRTSSNLKRAAAVTVERPGAPMAHDVVMQSRSSDSVVQATTEDIASPQALLQQAIVRTPTPPRGRRHESMDALRRASMMRLKDGGKSLYHDFDNAGGKDLIDTFSDIEMRDGPAFNFDSPSTSSPNAYSGTRYFHEDAIYIASDQGDPICGHETGHGDHSSGHPLASVEPSVDDPSESKRASTKRSVRLLDQPSESESSLPVKKLRSSDTASSSSSAAPSVTNNKFLNNGTVRISQQDIYGTLPADRASGDVNITVIK